MIVKSNLIKFIIIFLIFGLLCLLIPDSSVEAFRDNNLTSFFSTRDQDQSLANTERQTVPARQSGSDQGKYDFLTRVNFFSSQLDEQEPLRYHNLISERHNCRQIAKIRNPLFTEQQKTRQLTLMAEIKVKDRSNIDEEGIYKLFHCGNNDSTIRTPGVFLQRGHLVVVTSTIGSWNQEIWKSDKQLKANTTYRLIINYSGKTVKVYLDNQLVKQVQLVEEPTLSETVWLGRHPKENNGVDIDLTLYTVSGNINPRQLSQAKTIKDYLYSHTQITGKASDGLFDLNYDNYGKEQ